MMCFMAIKQDNNEVEENFSYDDLLLAYEELHEEMKKISKKNNFLKNKNATLL